MTEAPNKFLSVDKQLSEQTAAEWRNKPVATIRAEEEKILTVMQDVKAKRDEGKTLLDVDGLDGTTEEEKADSFLRLHTTLSGLSDAREYARRTEATIHLQTCLLYTSPSPRDRQKSRMPSSA